MNPANFKASPFYTGCGEVIYFVSIPDAHKVADALAEEFGHPPALYGWARDGVIDETAPHHFTIGDYVKLYPHDGVLPDETREYRCQTEYPDTTRAVFARLGAREITADEVRS